MWSVFSSFLYIINLRPVVRASLYRLPSLKKGIILVLTCPWPLSPPSLTPSLTVTGPLISLGVPLSVDTPDSHNHSAHQRLKTQLDLSRLVVFCYNMASWPQLNTRGVGHWDRLSVPRSAWARLPWLAAKKWRVCLARNRSCTVSAAFVLSCVFKPYLPQRFCQAPNLSLNITELHICEVTFMYIDNYEAFCMDSLSRSSSTGADEGDVPCSSANQDFWGRKKCYWFTSAVQIFQVV